jgi:Ca2+-binding RTX toxin-like protein
MSHARRRGLSVAAIGAVAAGIALSVAGTAAADTQGTVQIDNRQLIVTGTAHADDIALRVPAADPTVLEIDFGNDGTADKSVKLADFGALLVSTGRGDDSVRIDFGTQVQPPTVVDTGSGDDFVSGGSGNELFRTGDGNDFVDGNRGSDTALMGNGNDTFQWDPGDGSDVIEGGRGNHDTMLFNGAAGAEKFAAAANGERLRFTRDLGNIVMDTDDVERVDLHALGGADSVEVGDLSRTDVRKVDVDLGAGDGAVDAVTVHGTDRKDHIRVSGANGTVRVDGLRAKVTLTGAEPADQLTVDTQAGNDTVNSNHLAPNTIVFSVL